MTIRINHIGVAVRSLDATMKTYSRILGIEPSEIHRSPEMDMGIALYSLDDIKIEVMEPVGKEGPVARFIDTRGEGVHHICFEVEDIDKKLESLAADGVKLVDMKARRGLEGMVGFIHPKETAGVLMELLQKGPPGASK